MFLGQYEHNIDDKGRLTIPARYRELLAEGAYITRGFDRNLMVLTAPSFEQMYANINQMNIADPTARLLKRLILSSAEKLEVDKAGRILIPQYLRQAACLDGAAVVVGEGNYFEIWSQPLWAEQIAKLDDVDANSQRFAALELSVKA